MNIKKFILVLIVAFIILTCAVLLINVNANKNEVVDDNAEVVTQKIKVVSSNFACYDFLRAIIGNNDSVELTFLLGPGKDAHSYDPTAQDLITMQNSDLLVYIGGEMEGWADRVIDSLDNKSMDIICIADYVDTMDEKEVDGAEEHEHDHDHEDEDEDHDHEEGEEHEHEHEHEHEEGAFDEHIWTSPANAAKMVVALKDEMIKLDANNKELYENNANSYIGKIKDVDKKIKSIVDSKVRNRLIFGDKMPMQYFIDYYGLDVSAAFDGCSTETEPSAKTIAYLQDKAKEENIPVILYIELNDGRVAKVIANEVGNGCKAMQIQTLHNVSLDDFNKGETWVSLMSKNIDVLKAALQ